MSKNYRQCRVRRRFPGHSTKPEITGYLDQQSRMDYLKQKIAAEGRMRMFDEMPDQFREVYNAAGTIHNARICWNAGCRTFEQTERAVAGVWNER